MPKTTFHRVTSEMRKKKRSLLLFPLLLYRENVCQNPNSSKNESILHYFPFTPGDVEPSSSCASVYGPGTAGCADGKVFIEENAALPPTEATCCQSPPPQ